MVKILPDFLIVGAMKAGSTTLMDYLFSHEEVGIPKKEINYFDKDVNYLKGDDWYSSWFKKYAAKKVIGEKTPAYSYDTKSIRRIQKQNPKMKLVWILRNPVKRTCSNYWHYIRIGKEILTLKQSLERENERIKKDIYKGYFKRSIYADQVENYLAYFPMEQMHFIIFEDFINYPKKNLDALSKFLNIKSTKFTQKNLISNKGYRPLSINAEYYTRQFFGYGIIHKVVHIINKLLGSKYVPIDSIINNELYMRFEPENKRLEHLLGKDLSCWKKPKS